MLFCKNCSSYPQAFMQKFGWALHLHDKNLKINTQLLVVLNVINVCIIMLSLNRFQASGLILVIYWWLVTLLILIIIFYSFYLSYIQCPLCEMEKCNNM